MIKRLVSFSNFHAVENIRIFLTECNICSKSQGITVGCMGKKKKLQKKSDKHDTRIEKYIHV